MGLLRANGIGWQGGGPTLAAVHRPGWFRQRRFAAYLVFALCILSTATIAFFEWEMLRAETPERPGELLRWIYLPLAFLTISLVLFVRLHLRASRGGAVQRDVAGQLVGRLLESMPSAVVVTDDRGSIRFANGKAQAMFRYSGAQLIGIRIESLISTSSRSAYADECQTLARCGQPGAAAELSAVRSDDSGIDVEIGLAPIDVDGERLTVVTINDIGERKRLEREAALQRDELAHLSRTASLSALSSSLAHELIQPLTAILSNAQAGTRFLAHQPCNIEAGRASLDSVVDNAKRASDVIRKLRSMLRKGESELIPLDINDVVHDIMQIIRSELMERHVRVVLELAEGLPKVRGDRVHLQQVMMNLMMNAADAMSGSSRSRRLTIRTVAVDCGRSRGAGGGQRDRHCARRSRTHIRSVRHQQAARHGPRPFGLRDADRGARGQALGDEQRRRRGDAALPAPALRRKHQAAAAALARWRRGCAQCSAERGAPRMSRKRTGIDGMTPLPTSMRAPRKSARRRRTGAA